jgi:predicted nucleic acid-binding protein
VLLDTSAAVPLVVTGHAAHPATLDALDGRVLGLAGHAWFETFSVLTRLPPPARRAPAEVVVILEHNFPFSHFLGMEAARHLRLRLDALRVSGGAVYDALVGAAAAERGLPLVSRDRRAAELYRSLDVEVELLA